MQLGRQTDCFSSHGTHILPLFDSSGISLVWLSYKSVDFDWIEIYIISSWEFWKLIAHCPESVISLFYIHSRINLDMLPHIAALDVFSIRFWIKQKSHNKRCIDNCYLAMVKKKERTPRSPSPFLIISLKDERNIKLFDKIFPLYTVPGKCKWVHIWLETAAQFWQAAVIAQDSQR